MREILFKGKRIDNGEWVEGNLFIHKDGEKVDISTGTERFSINSRIDSSTICQYTGLTDKNGKKIWENDIICNHYDDLFPEDETILLIVWDNFGWKIKESYSPEEIDTAIDIENCEVAGNIFDNPELLKED